MIYQRHIPPDELIAAQLEMLMQSGRRSTISLHFVGVIASVVMFWPFMPFATTLLWAAVFLILLLARSLLMSNALVERSYQTRPRWVYWQLIIGAALTGTVWSAAYILSTRCVSVADRYDHGIFVGLLCCRARIFCCLSVCFPVAHCLVEPGSLLGSTL